MDNESTWARLWWRITNEPAMIAGLVEAMIGAAFAFELIDWSGEQVGAVMLLVGLLTGVSVRQTVYGPRKVGDVLSAAAHASEAAMQTGVTLPSGTMLSQPAGPTPSAEDLAAYFEETPSGGMDVEHAGPQGDPPSSGNPGG